MAGKVRVTADVAYTRWANRMANSAERIREGVRAVRVAPGELAAAQADKWQQNTINARAKWERNVRGTTLAQWQSAMENKGIPNIQTGVNNAREKYVAAATKLYAYMNGGLAEVEGMPNTTSADAKARMNRWFDYMSAYTG